MRTKYELEGLYRVARQRDFLDTFFPAEADIDAILTSMSSKRHYDGGIWKDLPNSPGQAETAYYRPLVEIANAIALQVGKNRDGIPKPIEDAGPIQGIWVVRASKSPDSSDPTAPKVRPNVCLVSNADHIVELDNRIDEEREKSEKDTARGLRRHNRERSIAVDELSIWWQHIHTCIEIKTRSDDAQREGAREQLCRYLKMSFKNQLDRRFVFGITLCHDLLDVYLCDRMGIIGMDVPINIHEDPKSFIRVVAGFSTLTATLLGWDPDMKVYLPDTGEAKRSYDPSLEIKYFREGTHSTQWVIELPEAEHEDLKRVVTIRAIGAVSAEMMSGRATVVWEVVRYKDIPFNVEQIFILKRYWRPLVKPCEGKLYKKLKSHDERIIASGDARIGGSVDSTLEFIRHGIDVFEPYSVGSGHPPHQDAPKRDEARPESEAHLPQIVTAAGSPLSRSIASRVHAWVLLPFSGWVVRHFKDLPELLSVVLGGIKDHQEFFDAGILHRDVSIGNLLIAPAKISREDGKVQVVKTKAALIDLDHAKFTEEKAFIKRFSATPEDVGRIRDDVGVVDEEVSRKAITAVRRRHALDYIETVLLFRGLSVDSSRLLSCKDLHWTHDSDAREERPDYGRHIPWDGDHIGTHQYMSIEVASGNFARGYYHCTFGSGIKRRFIWSESVDGTIPNAGIGGFSHDMIHDIESFFWILVNLALTRRGPGLNMMREELDPNSEHRNPQLISLVRDLFDYPIVQTRDAKRGHLQREDIFLNYETERVIPHFHPFFRVAAFETLVRHLWATLVLGYRFRAYEYQHIHKYAIHYLQEALKTVERDQIEAYSIEQRESSNAATEQEILRRNNYLCQALYAFNRKGYRSYDPNQPSPPMKGRGQLEHDDSIDANTPQETDLVTGIAQLSLGEQRSSTQSGPEGSGTSDPKTKKTGMAKKGRGTRTATKKTPA